MFMYNVQILLCYRIERNKEMNFKNMTVKKGLQFPHLLLSLKELTSRLRDAGEIVAIIEVLVRPPRESCRILVNLDSL